MKNTFEENDGYVLIRVKVSPGSEDFRVKGINKWTGRLEIDLASQARGGEANRELFGELSDIMNKNVSIKTGLRSRKKIIKVEGASRGEVRKKLEI